MELKVLCSCGQKYKFDVEPVGRQMPFTVNCPACQRDGTAVANQLLAEHFAGVPTPPPAPGGLKINRATPPAPLAIAPAGDNPLPPPIGALRPFAVAAAENPPKKKSFGMGLLGGLIGAVAGALVYYLIFKYTGLRFKILAVGVGALAGWLAELLGKGEGSKELGGITAVLALSGVVAAQYFVALGWWHQGTETRFQEAQSAYANAVIEAEAVVKAVPTGSDAEIRQYMVKQGDDAGVKLSPSDISSDDVKDFHDNQLPEYQALAGGQINKEQYEQQHDIKTSQTQEEADADEGTFKAFFLLLLISKANLFSLAAAAALAFRLSANA